jgi:2'-5' RNA ligase
MSICIAIIPPKAAIQAIRSAMHPYSKHLTNAELDTNWHIPLVTGDLAPITKPLRLPFHQTIRILSIGEGEEKMQLWARIQPTLGLTALQESLTARMKISGGIVDDSIPFTPHIYLGSFEQTPPLGIIDTPLSITFSIPEAHILQTDPYEILGTIPLTP